MLHINYILQDNHIVQNDGLLLWNPGYPFKIYLMTLLLDGHKCRASRSKFAALSVSLLVKTILVGVCLVCLMNHLSSHTKLIPHFKLKYDLDLSSMQFHVTIACLCIEQRNRYF